MSVKQQSKAFAGALAGLVTDAARHFYQGGELETLANSSERVLELAFSLALGYAVVYLAPKNADKAK